MSISNPLPWFAIVTLCMVIGWALARTSAFYRAELDAQGRGRFDCVDGLRGFLALAVFGGHAVNMHSLHTRGVWQSDYAPFHHEASIAGVALFFMITGFLFWLRVLRSGPAFDTRGFFISRLRRLTPMYLMSVLMVLAVIGAATGFTLHVSPTVLARQVRDWLSFGFADAGVTNGMAHAEFVNAVYWTLAFEWMFYLALPLLALFARGWRALLLFAAVIFFGTQTPIVFNFMFGAFAAMIVHARLLEGRLKATWLAVLPLFALCIYFALPTGRSIVHAMALFGFFIFIVHGNSLFGLLRTRAARVLGTISYSIYLTHCIALFVTVSAADRVVPIRSLDAGEYWLLVSLAAAACVLLSAFTYRYVEHPFLQPRPVRKTEGLPVQVVT